ncbi:MAG: hypothetical protein EP329_19985 [Deltaproteobacteria bacterium]|nr:MAG: hypothetical protein EP329_19985 [Deltaproteobacteria bacterium]
MPHVRRAVPRSLAAFALAGVVMLGALTPTPARAENPALEGAPPVLRGVKLLDGRNTLSPQFGMTLNDPYERNLMAGLGWRYFLDSWIGVGVDLWAGGGISTALTDDINRELTVGTQSFQLGTSSLRLLANAAVELVPFVGKGMIFGDQMVRVDLHIDLGIGVALTSGSGRVDDEVSIAPMFGVGLRFFPNDWLSVGIDLKDYLVNRVLASRKDGSVPGASFDHNWLLGLSVGFFFPTEPERDE